MCYPNTKNYGKIQRALKERVSGNVICSFNAYKATLVLNSEECFFLELLPIFIQSFYKVILASLSGSIFGEYYSC